MIDQVQINDYSSAELDEALKVLTRIGVVMLQSGAASFRAKQTMDRFAAALQIEQFDAFVTPTKIIGIVNSPMGSHTRAMRIPLLGVNMARVNAVHALSHNAKGLSLGDLSLWLDRVEASKPDYPWLVVITGVAAACGSFALILGAGPLEFIAAATGAACSQFVRMRLVSRQMNPYLTTAICAAIATLVSYMLIHLMGAPAPRIGLIASVLLLVPGVPLVTALLDLLHLDLISGVTRGVYAAILLINIGIGMLLALALTGFSIL
jgi:uncharacterized membrane protein YjjP (DUF1212 family)